MKINAAIIALVTVTTIFINQSCSSASYNVKDSRMNYINESPQFSDGKFKNTVEWEEPSFGEYFSMTWDFLFTGDQRSPDGALPSKKVNLDHFNNPDTNQLNVTWLGHSSLMINIDGYKILTDPVFEKRVSFFGPTRFNGDVPLNIEEIPNIDVVIISHNHYDHLNGYSIKLLNEKTGRFFVPLGVGAELEGWGVPRAKITELDWWDEIQVNEHLMIAATPAQHFSGRGLSDRYETLWASWVIKSKNHKVFFSGDSGYFDAFKTIGEKYGPFNMTFLESGAYNERWHILHMYPEEAVQANIDLRGDVLHPIHWGTFDLSLHSWFDPIVRLTDAADSLGVTVATPIVGETTVYNTQIPQEKWWEKQLVTQD